MLGFLSWTAQRDAKLELAVDKYEDCVLREYNTNPSDYYQEHNEYPPCD